MKNLTLHEKCTEGVLIEKCNQTQECPPENFEDVFEIQTQ